MKNLSATIAVFAAAPMFAVSAARAEDLPDRCTNTYAAAMLMGIGQRCSGHHFHLTDAGKRTMYALMRAGEADDCVQRAMAKIAFDLAYNERTAAQANTDPVELWCGSAAIFLLPLGSDLVETGEK